MVYEELLQRQLSNNLHDITLKLREDLARRAVNWLALWKLLAELRSNLKLIPEIY